jgi:membrane protease YdiL (CAAX protease family)
LLAERSCLHCGQQAALAARFCRRCGTDLESAEARRSLGVAVVEHGPQALDGGASPRDLWLLSGLPVAISVVYAVVTRFTEVSAVGELIGLAAMALVSLVGAAKNWTLVQKGLRLPSVSGAAWTVLVACVAWPLLTLVFALLQTVGFRIESDYLLPYVLEGWPAWSGYVSIAVVTPITEELLFRGLIQPKLEQTLRPSEALIVQAVLFSAAHLSPVILATHFAMGLAFGWVRRRSGSLLPSILLHGAWNAWVIWSS